MNNKDFLEAPYKRLQATEEKIELNSLLDTYRNLFLKHYHDLPLLPNSSATDTMIKDFKRLTKDKAHPILEHYFQMKNDWEFTKEAHSLPCLLKNYHRIAADLSKRQPKDTTNRKIAHRTWCGACWKDFVVVGDTFDLDKKTPRCNECELVNAPLKRDDRHGKKVIKEV